MEEPFLSAVIIAHNESHNIERCLRSLLGVADEIVVVDSGSADDTVAKSEALGARVFHHSFEGHIQQKNWAAQQAKGKWLISLDADESLSKELSASLTKWKAKPPAYNGYRVNRLTSYCGHWVRHGGWYPDQKMRLWRNGKAAWTGENPHDRLELSLPGMSGHLQGDLLHHSYHSVEDHIQQIDYFSDIAAVHYAGAYWFTGPWLRPFKMAFQWSKNALIRGGWRDGWAGWTIAKFSARATAIKYDKARRYMRSSALLRLAGKSSIRKILICRTDAIGDTVLTLPIAGWIKQSQPRMQIDFLVRSYSAPVVEAAIDVDKVVVWSEETVPNLSDYDAAIMAFPDLNVAKSLHAQGVSIIVGTSRRWPFRRWVTHKNNVSRKLSGQHEAWHGIELARSLHPAPGWKSPGLKLPSSALECQKWGRIRPGQWSQLNEKIDGAEDWIVPGLSHIIVHPGSAGSANNWSIDHYEQLVRRLCGLGNRVILTGTASEAKRLGFQQMDFPESVVNTMGKLNLEQLLALIGVTDVLVASSTGPLHMAAASNVACIGLYGSDAPEWPERWHPLGPNARWLTAKHGSNDGTLTIEIDRVLDALAEIERKSD
jgi:ADP-heptose:LPS heptosyltransferase